MRVTLQLVMGNDQGDERVWRAFVCLPVHNSARRDAPVDAV